MREIINLIKDMENVFGLTGRDTVENIQMTRNMVKDNLHGKMGNNMKEIGSKVKCMDVA